jgi:hypothetical protein
MTMFLTNQLDSHDTVKSRSVLSNIIFKHGSGEFSGVSLKKLDVGSARSALLEEVSSQHPCSCRFVSSLVVHL